MSWQPGCLMHTKSQIGVEYSGLRGRAKIISTEMNAGNVP